MIKQKTADLIVASTVGAGIVAGVSEEEQKLLWAYGDNLGMAYQVCDDVISIWADGATTGKRDYGDIKERKKTLPILFAFNKLNEEDRKKLVNLYEKEEDLTNEDCEAVIELLNSVDTLSVMQGEIDEYATKAKEAARGLSLKDEARDKLENIVDTLLPGV